MGKKIVQFGYMRCDPVRMNWNPVVDCRVMRNPYNVIDSDEVLRERVRGSQFFTELVESSVQLLKDNDIVYIGCYGGKHRSWAVAEEVAKLTGATIERV